MSMTHTTKETHMSEMTATFNPQLVVDALEDHRENIMTGQTKQMFGDTEGALGHAIDSINSLMDLLFGMLSEENRRELRQLTADTRHHATYFNLPDDEEWCDEWDAAHPEHVNA